MGQASATLSAATSQHLTAVLGGHSLTEAVLLGALTLLGLIGTEHCMTPPLNKIGVQRSAETLCRTYSTASEFFFRYCSTLFSAAQTARLILYKEKVILSTKILTFFRPVFLKKQPFSRKKGGLNIVVGSSFLSQDMVSVPSRFFDYYIRICIDFPHLFCYNKLNMFMLLKTQTSINFS